MYGKLWVVVATTIMITGLSLPAGATEFQQDMPEVMQSGNITYVTGGVGLEERDAMKTVAKDYNLIVSHANGKGKFTAGITIVIKDKNGKEIFMEQDTGPLFYAVLPAGKYTLEVMNGDEQQKRKVSISGQKRVNVHFVWTNGKICNEVAPATVKEPVKEEQKDSDKQTKKTKEKKSSKDSNDDKKVKAESEETPKKGEKDLKKKEEEEKEKSGEKKSEEKKDSKKPYVKKPKTEKKLEVPKDTPKAETKDM